jgi:hypothetical protein
MTVADDFAGGDSKTQASSHSFLVLASFIKALVHQARTPLSTISNELHFFQSKLPAGECAAALKQCQELDRYLRTVTLCSEGELRLEEIDLNEVLSAIVKSGMSQQAPRIQGDRARLELAVQLLAELGKIERGELEGQALQFVTALSAATARLNSTSFFSYSQLFCVTLHRDLVQPPIIDAILWAHGVQIELQVNGQSLLSRWRFVTA